MRSINFALGVGTLIILGALIVLGIEAFHPAPPPPQVLPPSGQYNTSAQLARQQHWQAAWQSYQAKRKLYDRDLFYIANIVGLLVFAAGFLLSMFTRLQGRGVLVGAMLAGFYGMAYGYAEGWGSVDARLRFLIGLVLAAIVIGGSLWLLQRSTRQQTPTAPPT